MSGQRSSLGQVFLAIYTGNRDGRPLWITGSQAVGPVTPRKPGHGRALVHTYV